MVVMWRGGCVGGYRGGLRGGLLLLALALGGPGAGGQSPAPDFHVSQ